MSAGGQTLGVFGFVKLGGTQVLTRAGASFGNPRNLDEAPPIQGAGGYGPINIGEGLQFPVFNVPAVGLDNGAAGWLTAANLNAWFITRSARPVWDLSPLAQSVFSSNGSVGDGRGSWRVNGVKGMGFTLSVRKGQEIGFNLRFCGRNREKALNADLPPATTTLTGAPLMFDRIGFPGGGTLEDRGITAITLNFDCGTTPNMELDGSIYPVEHNAGLPTASCTIEYNSLNTIAPLGYNPTTDTWETLNDVVFTLTTVSSPLAQITFTMTRMECTNPFDVQTQIGRVSVTRQYKVYGSTTAQPVVIA